MNMNMKKSFAVFCVALMAFCLMCGSAFAAEKVLRVALMSDINGLDPHKISDVYSGTAGRQIYNGLVQPDANMNFKPDLAKSWENPDDVTWIFKLHEGVLFHNGEEFTANDVKFTMERMLDPATKSPGATYLREIDKIEVVDKYTVKIITKGPYAPLLASFGRYEMGMLNEKAVKEAGEDYSKNPVGTGPFKFVLWRPGDRVEFAKFDKYFKGAPKLDKIIIRGIPEDATRVIELESGGIDLCIDFPPQDYARAKSEGRFVMMEKVGISTNFFGFNVESKPFENKKVRQALNYAVDMDALIDALYFGLGVRARGPISEVVWGFDDTLPKEVYPHDITKAKELLKEAGYPNGFKTKLYSSTQSLSRATAEMFQGFLAEVGVQAEVVSLEWGAFLAETRKGVDGMYTMGFSGTGDADGAMTYPYDSKNIDSSNRSRWNDPKFDAYLQAGRAELNPEKRKAIYAEAMRYFNDEAPIVLMLARKLLTVASPKVKGFEIYPTGVYPLYEVSLSD